MAIVIQPDGKAVLGGQVNGVSRLRIARLGGGTASANLTLTVA